MNAARRDLLISGAGPDAVAAAFSRSAKLALMSNVTIVVLALLPLLLGPPAMALDLSAIGAALTAAPPLAAPVIDDLAVEKSTSDLHYDG